MKKLFALCLAAVLLLSLSIPCLAAETMLARGEIPPLTVNSVEAAGLKTLGILKGTDSGMELDRNVTRAEAVMLIWRTTGTAFNDIGYLEPSFSDISGHWAEDAIEKFYHAGFVDGTSKTTFEPDRFVTGQEFVKILLTVMGYEGVTLENAYDKGKETGVLSNNFTKSVVYNNVDLLRGDAARLCFHALTAEMPEGEMLYKTLIDKGIYEQKDFEGVLFAGCGSPAAYQENFVDKLNAQMPKDENYMFSPLSIKMAFAMAANGAGGETKSQILNALEIDDLNAYNQKSKELIAHYNQSELLKFNVANSIWINKDRMSLDFTETFKKTVQEFYFNPVRLLSLQSRLSAAYKGIMARILKNQCKDFISGREMDFTVYKAESIDIHHIFPRDYCEKKGLPRAKWNSVVNKTPITYSTNREIGGVAQSQYLTKIEKKGQVEPDILDGYLKTHLIDTSDIRADRFDDFFIKRATAILNEIEKATGKSISGRDSDLVIQDFGGALL